MRHTISSGSPWEQTLGYSRAVVAGDLVFVSATAATGPDGKVAALGDVHAQTTLILDKIAAALGQAGCGLEHVAQTRIYLTDIARWEEAGRAHGEVFGEIRPAMTMLHVKPFLDPAMLVEVEALAVRPVVS